MATFILVHGMWHGGWCWQRVARRLRAVGHEVYTPTLTGLGERAHLRSDTIDLNIHIHDVVSLLEYEDVSAGILVGHSFGGSIVPIIAAKAPNRITRFINVDGPILENGMALKDTIPDFWDFFQRLARDNGDEWWIPPVTDWTFGTSGDDLKWMQSKLTPHPLRALTTPVSFTRSLVGEIPPVFISCVEDRLPEEVAAEARDYNARGWEHRSLATGHDAMITMPEELATLLMECAAFQN